MPPRRATHWFAWIVAAWTIVGVVTALLRESLARRMPVGILSSVAVGVVVHWFWIPVTLAVVLVATGRSRRGQTGRAATWLHLALCAIVVLAEPLWSQAVLRAVGVRTGPYWAQMLGGSDTNVVFYVATVAAVLAAWSFRMSVAAELVTTRLEGALAESQVQVLTMQLQPHFLFNTLHLVSEEMFADPAAAKQTLADLRNLLTQSFAYAACREVTLDEELEFLAAYVAIQDRRFRGRLSVAVDVPADLRRAMVPHLLLQPLVENAIRHGIAPRAAGGTVWVRARRDGDRLDLSVEDDGVGLPSTMHADSLAGGLGVTHTRARLQSLHGEQGTLTIGPRAGGGAATHVSIPFGTTPRASDAPSVDAPDVAAPQSPMREPWPASRIALTTVAAWVGVAVMWSQLVAVALDAGGGSAVGWLVLLQGHLVIALTAAALSWPILRLARTVTPGARRIAQNLLAHSAIALAAAGVHAAVALGAFAVLGHWTSWAAPFARTYRGGIAGWMMWDVVAYLAVVAFLNRGQFAEWQRRTQLDADRLRLAVASARLELVRLQFQPAVLLAGLDAVARAAGAGPHPCEEVIASFGDVLRQMLAGVPVSIDAMERALEVPV